RIWKMIYNLLFIHSYILALRSKSNQDMPLFVPVMFVTACFIINMFSMVFLLEGAGISSPAIYDLNKYVIDPLLLGAVFFYYLHDKRYKTIYESYKERPDVPSLWRSIFIVALYYIVSALIIFLCAFYRNKDWIFSA